MIHNTDYTSSYLKMSVFCRKWNSNCFMPTPSRSFQNCFRFVFMKITFFENNTGSDWVWNHCFPGSIPSRNLTASWSIPRCSEYSPDLGFMDSKASGKVCKNLLYYLYIVNYFQRSRYIFGERKWKGWREKLSINQNPNCIIVNHVFQETLINRSPDKLYPDKIIARFWLMLHRN